MTATTDHQNGRRALNLLKRGDDQEIYLGQAYPRDPYPEDTVELDTLPPPPVSVVAEPDVNAEDSGRVAPAMLPILPPWAKTASGVRRNVTHAGRYGVNQAAYHGIKRGYAVRPVGWAVRGGWRLSLHLVRYAIDAETLAMERHAAENKNGRARQYERKERHRTRNERTWKTCAVLAAVLAAVLLIVSPEVSPVLRAVLAAGVLAVLIHNGRPNGDPDPDAGPVRTAGSEDPARTLVRSDRVVASFTAASFPGTMTVGGMYLRDRGPEGWEGLIDLPEGTTASKVLAKREELASAFRVAEQRLLLSRAGHAGQVLLTIFNEDPMTADPVRSPLADLGTFSMWDPVPVGTTVLGDLYGLVLPGTSGAWICSAPGYGKSTLVLALLAAGVLDPRATPLYHDGKGEGGFSMYEKAVLWSGEGCGDDGAKRCLEMLDVVYGMREDRAKLISSLRREDPRLMPHGQITPAVTGNPEFGLPLVPVIIDELNFLVAHRKHGSLIQERVMGLSQMVRSGGIVPIIAGQRFDSDTLGGAQASLGIRVAFRTMNAADSNLVLGTGRVGDGYDTSRWPDDYQGVCLVNPSGFQAHKGIQQVKTYLFSQQDHERIGALGVDLVRRAPAPPKVQLAKETGDLLARVLDAMGDENVVPVDDLTVRLGVDVEALVEQLRDAKVPIEPSRQHGNRRAVRRRDVVDRT